MLYAARSYSKGSVESMLGSCISTVATPSTAHVAVLSSSSYSAVLSSSVKFDKMLRVIRFQAHRRLIRRSDIRHDLRYCRQLEPSTQPHDYSPQAFDSCGSYVIEAGLETKESKGHGLYSFRSYFPTTRASLADSPFRRFKKDKEIMGRRDLLSLPHVYNRRNIFGDVGPITQVRELGYYSYQEYSDDESGFYENDVIPQYVDIERWRWRLNQFLRDGKQQEMVCTDKKDRRDHDHIGDLMKQMGLHMKLYSKVLVISKAPLPNYRPDLDERRPQRLVSFPSQVQRKVDALLKEFAFRKKQGLMSASEGGDIDEDTCSDVVDAGLETADMLPGMANAVQELQNKRNRQIRNKQRGWQESEEGQRILEFRKSLPAYKQRDALLAAVARNQVVVVSGETGCGKTTQLPQYILESEIEAGRGATCSVICTQPRRISAVSVAERVAAERGENIGESVGYQVRLEGMRSRQTQLLFCTTGILLRRLMNDRELKGVSHVVVDEIHERGMNEDFLLIVLKDLLPRRPDLRLVLMSATLNADLFSSYFNRAPMAHIPGFTYPVKSYFLEDILETTGYRLTATNQIDDYGQDKQWKIRKQYVTTRKKNPLNSLADDALAGEDFRHLSPRTQASLAAWSPDNLGFNLIENVLLHVTQHEQEGAVLVFMTGWEEITALKEQLQRHPVLGNPDVAQILACHGTMATAEQKLIFEHPPPGVRKIVLATNMAETSITINDVVFVIDCGKAKETSYDALNNTPCLLPTWISQASARQRRGRAGRVTPGISYHLYPRAVYDAFAEYQQPELLRTPLHSLCLQIKSLKLGSVSQFLSRALQPPEPLAVQNSVELLKTIGALDEKENLTRLGKHLSLLPVEPNIGKMLIMGSIFGCLDPILTIAAGLAVRDPFIMPSEKKELADESRLSFAGGDASDHIALVRAYEGWQEAMTYGTAYDYCWKNFLSFQTLQGMTSLRKQFSSVLRDAGFLDNDMEKFNKYSGDRDLVRGVICSGMYPGVISVYRRTRSTTFKTIEDGQVMLHQNSVNSKDVDFLYPWLVFTDKVKTSNVMIRDTTGVSDSMLLLFGGQVNQGGEPGHLVMNNGFMEFFMEPSVALMYLRLRKELDDLISRKLANPEMSIYEEGKVLMRAVFEVLDADQCEGSFTFGRKVKASKPLTRSSDSSDVKGLLQTLLLRAGKKPPVYRTRMVKGNLYQSSIEVKGRGFTGDPASSKKVAEKNVSAMALEWLTGLSKPKRMA
ncbi:DExH-box ATP-dependent RNA helicase DExH3 [Physcomitrium patens]|uniref:RNA helicase n=1 Tax=Physcomitrium patens TaxID=3218 RepID=A0A2K1L418_PHYPA|nr:DExH-box ATP-dependent RNA helicase DExH3-like [Physcomitrium patens]PNR60770.1 hypothetical protein PHYPA_003563 [Physcomitrium patens]|eukprot:XP_024401897.1 DExH-box ATP-dependent RNA helicase DExH3-like [Physcomitrella patens]